MQINHIISLLNFIARFFPLVSAPCATPNMQVKYDNLVAEPARQFGHGNECRVVISAELYKSSTVSKLVS